MNVFTDGRRPHIRARRLVLVAFSLALSSFALSAAVDEMAARGEAAGCLALSARMMPPPVGYICMLRDPDGNMVEFSWDQGVYARLQERWSND